MKNDINLSQFVNVIINFISNNQAFVALFSALLGAIVGSLSGYLFNRQLEKQKAKERYWIQRKNTIYSPLYKELLALKAYLSTVLNATERLIRIEFENIERSDSFTFSMWESIKRDIRYDYIPDDLKKMLDELTQSIQMQISLQDTLFQKFKDIAKSFYDRNKDKFNENMAKDVDVPGSLYHSIYNTIFPRRKPEESPIKNFIGNYIKESNKRSVNRIATNLEKEVRETNEYRILKKELRKLLAKTDNTIEAFRSLIVKIISASEGGMNYE